MIDKYNNDWCLCVGKAGHAERLRLPWIFGSFVSRQKNIILKGFSKCWRNNCHKDAKTKRQNEKQRKSLWGHKHWQQSQKEFQNLYFFTILSNPSKSWF